MRICDLTTLWIDGSTCGGVNTYLVEKARYLAQRGAAEHVIVVPGEHTGKQRLYGSTLYTIKSPCPSSDSTTCTSQRSSRGPP
jgi:hypothetical protein